VDDVIGLMDGVSLTSECTSKPVMQNLLHRGYHSDTMVNNLFAYGSDGRVIFFAINFPGNWNDGSITANGLPYICKKIGTYKMCIDQGLPRSGDALDVLVAPVSCTQAY
jgi:hypothetical protein